MEINNINTLEEYFKKNYNVDDIYLTFKVSKQDIEFMLDGHFNLIIGLDIYNLMYFFELVRKFLNKRNSIGYEFCQHIFHNYVLKCVDLDKLFSFLSIIECSERYLYFFSTTKTEEVINLKKINEFFPIKNIIISQLDEDMVEVYKNFKEVNFVLWGSTANNNCANEIFANFKKLQKICCDGRYNITDDNIKHLTQLQSLECENCPNITDEGIKHLTQLQSLECCGCENITNEGIKHLTQLQTLNGRQYERK